MSDYPDLKTLRIVHYPAPVLRAKGDEIREVNSFLNEMAARMAELTHEANGLALAATQVAWPYRFVLVNPTLQPGGEEAFVNPVIIERHGRVVGEEGCLSVPGVFSKLRRAERVRVRATRLDGETVEMETEGLAARMWQHELDHLDGTLFVDRLSPAGRILVRTRLKDLEQAWREDSDSDSSSDETP